ncbi:beta-lactamase family protein [Candidatus Babeliales bacterium]|nr:beta-lactamase family protein [Candidatus Babeliales bacterium]MBP9843503.1 beta-lactamase family protein [Candidatus Babeliales bacterium]
MIMTLKLILAGILALACAGAGYVYVQTRPISADQQMAMHTRSGATFSIEKGWIATQSDDMMVLQEPGKELSFILFENNEDSADNAVLAAWHKIQPDFARTVQHRMVAAATDGWDEVVQFIYTTSTAENKFLMALARRVGTTWYVGLIDGTPGAVGKRSAGVNLIATSFKVQGVEKESFAGKVAHKLDDAKLAELMDFIEQARILCKIPGAAVGIVQDGKLICSQGFGVKQLGTQDLVTPETQFMIGSTTKSLTTLMMAKLVDEGKFNWNTPVTKVLPTFELGDKQTTDKLLMKHTVSANTGMPRHDIEMCFNYDYATPALRMAEMKEMKPTTGFGETFQYNNSMVMAGGYIAGHVAYPDLELGTAYDKAMQSRVFDPLNMTSTTFNFNQLQQPAMPHGQTLQGDYIAMPVDSELWTTSIRPAGALWSNVQDMAQYMIMELNKGVNAQGDRIISEQNLLERRKPQIIIADKMSYGLGLMTKDDHGLVWVGHGGNTIGFTAEMEFFPEHNLGFVILTNAKMANMFTAAVERKLIELLFDGKDQAQTMVSIGQEQNRNAITKNLESIELHPQTAWLEKFIGSYTHPVLGMIEIHQNGDAFELDARVWKSKLGQKKEEDGSLKLIMTEGFVAGIHFISNEDETGKVTQLILDDSQHKYVFERQ